MSVARFALLLLTVFWTTAAAAGPNQMPLRGPTAPPVGHVQFCADHPEDCGAGGQPNRVIRLDAGSMRLMKSINLGVNHAVVPATDMEVFGVVELWSYPGLLGDCEDYVIQKRHDLIEAGWPASAVLITVVRDEIGEGHAVLTVRTDKGDYILDNKTDDIRPWTETPYRYVKRQSVRSAAAWDKIEDSRTTLVGSVTRR